MLPSQKTSAITDTVPTDLSPLQQKIHSELIRAIDGNGQKEVERILSKNPWLIKSLPLNYHNPFKRACSLGKVSIIKIFLKAKADINGIVVPSVNIRPLHIACVAEQYAAAEHLLKAGADVGSLTVHNMTPLLLTIHTTCNPAIVELLLRYNANPLARNLAQFNALMLAYANPNGNSVLDILLKRRIDISYKELFYLTTVKTASNHEETFDLFLKKLSKNNYVVSSENNDNGDNVQHRESNLPRWVHDVLIKNKIANTIEEDNGETIDISFYGTQSNILRIQNTSENPQQEPQVLPKSEEFDDFEEKILSSLQALEKILDYPQNSIENVSFNEIFSTLKLIHKKLTENNNSLNFKNEYIEIFLAMFFYTLEKHFIIIDLVEFKTIECQTNAVTIKINSNFFSLKKNYAMLFLALMNKDFIHAELLAHNSFRFKHNGEFYFPIGKINARFDALIGEAGGQEEKKQIEKEKEKIFSIVSSYYFGYDPMRFLSLVDILLDENTAYTSKHHNDNYQAAQKNLAELNRANEILENLQTHPNYYQLKAILDKRTIYFHYLCARSTTSSHDQKFHKTSIMGIMRNNRALALDSEIAQWQQQLTQQNELEKKKSAQLTGSAPPISAALTDKPNKEAPCPAAETQTLSTESLLLQQLKAQEIQRLADLRLQRGILSEAQQALEDKERQQLLQSRIAHLRKTKAEKAAAKKAQAHIVAIPAPIPARYTQADIHRLFARILQPGDVIREVHLPTVPDGTYFAVSHLHFATPTIPPQKMEIFETSFANEPVHVRMEKNHFYLFLRALQDRPYATCCTANGGAPFLLVFNEWERKHEQHQNNLNQPARPLQFVAPP